jgi:mannose-1-phosphate guanylyltransferase/mannose-6-phosphate isomerase
MLEPLARNTAPAVAAAAMYLQALDPEALMLVLPADHVITDVPAFHAAIDQAAQAAQNGALATFGIVPTAPETGYGYIHAGQALAQAERLQSTALKNRTAPRPGIRRWQLLLEQRHVPVPRRHLSGRAQAFQPAMASATAAAVAQSYRDLDFCRLMKPRLLPARRTRSTTR